MIPTIDRNKTILHSSKKALIIVGENFDAGAVVSMASKRGSVSSPQTIVQDSHTIIINGVTKKDFPDGVATISVQNPSGDMVKETLAVIPSAIGPSPLTETDIRQIIGQGVAAAQQLGVAGTFSVVDREGNILAIYKMTGSPDRIAVGDVGKAGTADNPQGLEGLGETFLPSIVPIEAAAISKAGTGAFLSTFGNAFTTRTAAYIIREHLPPFIKNTPSGPLFGVQISSLGCSDVKMPGLPLGMSGDTGGIPIYKNGFPSGGIGVEINAQYNVALNRPQDLGTPETSSDELYNREGIEEMVAFAAQRGFEPPDAITADKILVNGIRFPYRRMFDIPQVQAVALESAGALETIPGQTSPGIRTGVPTEFRDIVFNGLNVRVVNRFFPIMDGEGITADQASQMLFQGAKEAYRVRAAIRRPIEVHAEVNVSLVDINGKVLGIVSTPDAPIFGFDVAVQKGRTDVFFSRPDTFDMLKKIGLGKYANSLFSEGLRMDGSFAFTSRAVGFIHRPYFPDDIEGTKEGPLSTPIDTFSPLNNGFQTDYLLQGANGDPNFQFHNVDLSFVIGRSILNVLTGRTGTPDTFFCDASNGRAQSILNSGLMIFSGSSPVFNNGQIAGAVGISGDGTNQDDIISAYGSEHFEVPGPMRCDRVYMRGIRIPYTKFPRHPHLGGE
jgi:uncharacterized protein GlcG (DUF336 family)